MTKILWDQVGERRYETGVDRGVLYRIDGAGAYSNGYGWNGLTTVTESPGGAESNKTYADNQVYLNLISVETFDGTIEAYTYPDEFAECDGSAELIEGVTVGQQPRKAFGLCYRTRVGNDVEGDQHGYKLHMAYGLTASPSEKAFASINDSPEALDFSWDISSIPVEVGTVGGVAFKPTSLLVVDSTKVDATALTALENALYGTVGTDPHLPLPADVYAFFSGTITEVVPTAPTYDNGTHTITIPTVTGVEYKIDGSVVTGAVVITENTVVTANPTPGHQFPEVIDSDWFFDYS